MNNQADNGTSDAPSEYRTARPFPADDNGRFAERLKSAIGDQSVRTIARISDVGEKSIRGYLNQRSEPRRPALVALAQALGVSLQWLATGVEQERHSSRVADTPKEYGGERFVHVPQYDVEVAAGDGRIPGAEQVVAYYAFRRDWVRRMGWTTDQLAIVICRGDSQEGVIDDGQPVLVNLADHDVSKEGLFVLRLDDNLLIKTLQMDWQGNVLLRSNNPRYREIQVPKDRIDYLHVLGRAVWTDRLL